MPSQKPLEALKLLPCDYCGKLTREDKVVRRGEHIFCQVEHKQKFYA